MPGPFAPVVGDGATQCCTDAACCTALRCPALSTAQPRGRGRGPACGDTIPPPARYIARATPSRPTPWRSVTAPRHASRTSTISDPRKKDGAGWVTAAARKTKRGAFGLTAHADTPPPEPRDEQPAGAERRRGRVSRLAFCAGWPKLGRAMPVAREGLDGRAP